jgi:hypothetical protein
MFLNTISNNKNMKETKKTTKSLNEIIKFKYFVALTNEGYWGRGDTLIKALRNADAINKNKQLKRNVNVLAFINLQKDGDQMTKDQFASDKSRGITHKGYQVGDWMKPFVDDYGSVNYKGVLIKIDFPK